MKCPSCQADNDDGAEICFNCRHVLTAITRGSVIASRYEVLSALGRGGMGVVYKAHDRVLEETVAIKLLRSEVSQDADVARRFRSEIKLARKVTHRNVCRIHEYGEDQGLRYICMEYIDGIDLKQVIRQTGALSSEEAFEVASQLAQGLDAIHDVGIVHRDLKTPNIMRDSRGVVRLMDFGIAKQTGADATTGATATGQVVGTPEYMSPEQARGQKVDLRTDIYALGVVIFEIFTGQVPFKGETPVATLFMHVQDPPPLEGPAASRIPPALVPVLRKALAKKPDERYATAREMAEALREARSAAASQAPYAPTPRLSPTADMPSADLPSTPANPEATTVAAPRTPRETAPPAAPARPVVREAEGASAPAAPAPRPRPRQAALPRPEAAPRRVAWTMIVSLFVGAVGLAVAVWNLWPSTIGPAPPERTAPSSAQSPPTFAPTPAPATTQAAPDASARSAPSTVSTSLATPKPTLVPGPPQTIAQARAAPPPTTLPVPAARIAPTIELPPTTTTLPAAPPPTPGPVPVTQASPFSIAAPAAEERGFLQLVVVPFADAAVDDAPVRRVTSGKIPLGAGSHVVTLNHPDYQPLRRKVTIVGGETFKLIVDMAEEAVRKKKGAP